MIDPVPRTVSVVTENLEDSPDAASRPLAEYRDGPAYVLLGPPGTGKTTAFRQEANSHENGEYVSARDFIALDNPGWSDKTLFIDGLDEMRAGLSDRRTPIDQIRSKLQQLECPGFRLSCRTTHWWWTNDSRKLEQLGAEILLLTLDPLTDADIPEVLRQHSKPNTGEPEEFISRACRHGLGELLKNPQTLLLLVESVDQHGGWPTTHREVYEKACETLLSEPNEEHIISGAHQLSMDTLSETAGRMCAVQLLSGVAGYTLPPGTPNEDYPALEKVLPAETGKQTARTRAFDKMPHREWVVPEHQCTAEFLGGRYLARQVEQGFSANRILTLMSSMDKVVVPKLQGLATWFAAYSHSARKRLIESIPLETALYGDVESFTTEDKFLLFDQLMEKTSDNPQCVNIVRWSTPLRGLASPDLHEYLKGKLRQPAHGDDEQSFRYLTLKALHRSPTLPEISDSLLEIIRDETSRQDNKALALDILIRVCARTTETGKPLKKLLAEIQQGSIRDFQGRLSNTLLSELFPQHISDDEALDFLVDSGQPSTATLHIFWANRFVELNPEQLTGFLNKLVARVNDARKPNLSPASFRPFLTFLAILQELFSLAPDKEISLLDLRHWLEVAWCSEIQHMVRSSFRQTASSVHGWLRIQPDKQREIFESGVGEWIGTDQFELHAMETGNWLFGLKPPPDFWPWCLDLAIRSETPEAAEFHLRQVVEASFDENAETGLSLDDIQARTAEHPELDEALKAMLVRPLSEDYFEEIETRQRRLAMDLHEREQIHQDWIEQVKAHEKELRENRGPSGFLHNLALAYFGYFNDVEGELPRDRIHNLLDHDPRLIQVVLAAFKKVISRGDAPSVAEIIRHAKQGQPHPLTYPCLAGMEEAETSPPTDPQIRRALAFHYFADYSLPSQVSPAWYKSLLIGRPELVSKILIRRVRFEMRKGEEFLTDSYELAFSDDHVQVARLAALPLLKSFPLRCTTRQLPALGYLLAAALLHCKHGELRKLLKVKLAESKTKNMNVGQQVYWRAARFIISPKTHRHQLESYLREDDQRMRCFAEFVCQGDASPKWDDLLKGKCLAPLIQLLGPSFRYMSLGEGAAWSAPPMAASGLMRELINHLANDASPTATKTLNRLVADDSLSQWRTFLQDATDEQRSLRRQSEFRHCSVDELLQTLDRNRPANMDDLVVLLLESFDEMGKKIRDGSTNDWRQYWNQSSTRSLEEWHPKEESDCRDAFLSDLQERVKLLGIDARREPSYADNTQADIQVSCKSLHLPIEVKKSHSKDLWKGIREQLVPKYTRDPDADGRGIYLVFWFGEDSPKNPRTGIRPASPDELQRQLEDSLAPKEADRVSIHVIDVAQPQAKTSSRLS